MNERLRRLAHDWLPRRVLLARWMGWGRARAGADMEHRLKDLCRAVLGLSNRPEADAIAMSLFGTMLRMRPDEHMVEELDPSVVPDTLDEPDQWELLRIAAERGADRMLLDFGCGVKADHRRTIESMGYAWRGLEVRDSRDPFTGAALEALRVNPDITLYDGSRVPFPDGTFGVVFSNQSLEHVQDCELSIREIARVLRPGGVLVGSVSHLEPYHGWSTFNYTPYGFGLLCTRNGLRMERLSPGMDALTLITRVLLAQCDQGPDVDRVFDVFHAKSPLNGLLDELCARGDLTARRAGIMKLNLCAQFRFLARKG